MEQVWILILCLYEMDLAQTLHLSQSVSFAFAERGKPVSLQCTFEDKNNHLFVWYKQRPGRTPQQIGIYGLVMGSVVSEPFKNNFKLEKTENTVSLTILQVSGDDEGMYFCGTSQLSVITFTNGTFLTVTGLPDSSHSISVLQSPASASVPPGERVTLQCSVLSEIRAAELRVLWFLTAAGPSSPEIIYTHQNSRQCEISSSTHSCVNTFSRNVLSENDTGTFYCAVATCGKIIIGNGTTVNLDKHTGAVNSSVIFFSAALGVCVVLISALAFVICRRKKCAESLQRGDVAENSISQDRDAAELSYAALHFSKSEIKRGRRKQPGDSVYSEVKH